MFGRYIVHAFAPNLQVTKLRLGVKLSGLSALTQVISGREELEHTFTNV